MADQEIGGNPVAGTFTITLPTDIIKKIEKAEMSDGSARYAFFKEHRRWKLNWVKLTKAELDALIAEFGPIDIITTWLNPDERNDVFDVVITDFSYDLIDPKAAQADALYKASMTLEEAV